MLGEVVLVNKGVEFSDHVQTLNELIKLDIKVNRPLNLLENLRKLRHKINYGGYNSTLEESKEAISIVKALFPELKGEVEKIVKE